ncbi:MAG: hypothetical protein KZQ93_18120 [Candidatus Thiodiazotropha sp. (ex Monitilora ramsayi)]|nr:hypothetical protein [Candidatus Thiodiazotropha sp. (ex Monitilora ramsayi)]
MPKCKPIQGLVLDKESQDAIERIKKKRIFGDALAGMISIGVFSNIFTRSNAAQASYNITQTDWILYAQTMNAVPIITKRAIEKEVEDMIVHYQLHYDPKQLKFWEGIYSGCK